MPLLTEEQAIERLNCPYFEDFIVTDVKQENDYVYIGADRGTFGFPAKYGVVPKVGDVVRRYDRNTYTRGVDVNEQPVYYKTEEEMDEDHRQWLEDNTNRKKAVFEEKRTKLDAEYRSLPPIFRKRIRWFRKHNENFRWEFEAYEMFCCTEAVKIATALKDPQAVLAFMGAADRWELVPDLSDAHSGNSMGISCRLAYHYLNDEEMVFFEHGALVPLVGCTAYGCIHPRPGVEQFAKERGFNE